MSNMIDSLVLAEYIDRDICLIRANDECIIASAARLDTWICVTAISMRDEREVQLGDKHKRWKRNT